MNLALNSRTMEVHMRPMLLVLALLSVASPALADPADPRVAATLLERLAGQR